MEADNNMNHVVIASDLNARVGNQALRASAPFRDLYCDMYQKKLSQYARWVPTSNNIEEEWSNVRYLLEKVGNEVLSKRRINTRKRSLKIWNE